MARGKQTCKILKEIRRQIAEANDIEFVTSECRYRGDCLGTCPKCEAEVRYLEQQLRARTLSGKAVALAGISAGLIFMSGCNGTSTKRPSETLRDEPDTLVEHVEEKVEAIDSIEAEDNVQPEAKDAVASMVTELLIVGEVDDDAAPLPKRPELPTFPGGEQKLYEWLYLHIVYPQSAIDANKEGRVVVELLIKADGIVSDAKILKSVDTALDAEALRIVKSLPKFNPATLDGKAVDYNFVLPVTFRLPDAQENKTDSIESVQATTDSITVKGVVSDIECGEPLVGVSIINRRTGKGVLSNIDGEFSIRASAGDSLDIRYIGYKSQTVAVTNDTTDFKIELVMDEQAIEAGVIVVGRGIPTCITEPLNTLPVGTASKIHVGSGNYEIPDTINVEYSKSDIKETGTDK